MESRRSADWYDQSNELTVLEAGDRMFIVCESGLTATRVDGTKCQDEN